MEKTINFEKMLKRDKFEYEKTQWFKNCENEKPIEKIKFESPISKEKQLNNT